MMSDRPHNITILEVAPRDGLQNEPGLVPTADKVRFIEALVAAGLKHIEVTSFVHPKAVPQFADANEVTRQLPQAPGVVFSALVPNLKGLERAIDAGVKRIAVFTAASETFTQKNINMTIAQSLDVFRPVVRDALAHALSVRGYVSTSFVCPFEGEIPKERVREVSLALLEMGVDEVSISDTIGAAAPTDVERTVGFALERIPAQRIALHFHDTYGTALANVCAGLRLGITTFDSSAGGLGGCPYAPGASGNLATEDLVYLFDRIGITTGVSRPAIRDSLTVIAPHLTRPLLRRPPPVTGSSTPVRSRPCSS